MPKTRKVKQNYCMEIFFVRDSILFNLLINIKRSGHVQIFYGTFSRKLPGGPVADGSPPAASGKHTACSDETALPLWHTNCCPNITDDFAINYGKPKMRFFPNKSPALIIALVLGGAAQPAWATQAHGAPEGLYVHQLSHLFFIFAMAILIYWLRSRGLVRDPGWRYIQYAALFFILWSFDAFGVHLLDEQFLLVTAVPAGPWQIRLDTPTGLEFLGILYYLMKLDHLLCVPGLVFLYLGLRRLDRREQSLECRDKGAA